MGCGGTTSHVRRRRWCSGSASGTASRLSSSRCTTGVVPTYAVCEACCPGKWALGSAPAPICPTGGEIAGFRRGEHGEKAACRGYGCSLAAACTHMPDGWGNRGITRWVYANEASCLPACRHFDILGRLPKMSPMSHPTTSLLVLRRYLAGMGRGWGGRARRRRSWGGCPRARRSARSPGRCRRSRYRARGPA